VNIGLLGGSFDPIHQGHIYIAERVLELFSLDQVWFLVANAPPHKVRQPITSVFHRFAMAAIAAQERRRLLASSWELEKGGVSFTIKTLEGLSQERPGDRFCFVAGSDSLEEIHLWREYDRLLTKYCFVFVQRPGSEVLLERLSVPDQLKEVIQEYCPETRQKIESGRSFLVDIASPPISSTSIRGYLAARRSPGAGVLSPAVLAYIEKYGLYEQNSTSPEEGS
jgi:nicotinate-nucleotide adenylyltransferase